MQNNTDSPAESWQESFKHYFTRTIRTRGNSYVRQKLVKLKQATSREISASVRGSRSYRVEISLDSRDGEQFRVYCGCPFFRKGAACKHLWAALVAADQHLRKERSSPPSKAKSSSSPGRTTSPSQAKSRSSSGRSSSRGGTPHSPSSHWKNALFPGQGEKKQKTSAWDGTPGGYKLCYELRVTQSSVSLQAHQQHIRKDGHPGRSRSLDPAILQDPELPQGDRIILKSLQTASSGVLPASLPGKPQMVSRADLGLILPYLAETGRCSLSRDGETLASPLVPGAPFELPLRLIPRDKDPSRAKNLQFEGVLFNGENDISLDSLSLILATHPLYCIHQGNLYRIRGMSAEQLRNFRSFGSRVKVPRQELGDFLEAVESEGEAPRVDLPEKLKFREESSPPLPRLRLEISEEELLGETAFLYGEHALSPDDPRQRLLDRQNWRALHRDGQAEESRLAELSEQGFRQDGESFRRDLDGAPEALRELAQKGWQVEGKDGSPLQGSPTPSVRVSSSGMDWFDLEGEVEFSGSSLDLPRAVREFLEGNRTVRLDDGSQGMLPLDWLRRHAGELSLGLESGNGDKDGSGKDAALRYHRGQALALDSLVSEDRGAELEESFRRLRDELRDFKGLQPLDPDPAFQGSLRGYQKEALGWFAFLSRFGFGGILADDMGLGKTIQVLAWLQQKKRREKSGPSLVVAPASLVLNWREEARRFTPELEVVAHVGPNRTRDSEYLRQADLVLTTYGILRREAEELASIEFDYAVLDESQAIKNSQSKTFRAAKALRAANRLCLTGTPLENNLKELWSQMDFLNPGLLRSSDRFERTLAGPASKGDSRAQESLRRLVKPFILRRSKEQVTPELPEKSEHTLACPMQEGQSSLYQRIREHYRAAVLQAVDSEGINRSKIKVLEGLLRLRQIACHPGLVDPESSDSGKMEKLRELVREARSGGRKALVFSQYTKLLGLIRKEFELEGIPYFYLDGRTPRKRRMERVQAFQEAEGSCFFLISLKAGGTGLNLTAADYVFILDPWWNPAVEMQAVDRTHRIGQDKTVFTYRLISRDSVEEKVLTLQERKQQMVSSVLSGSNDMIKNLTRQDLEHLFS